MESDIEKQWNLFSEKFNQLSAKILEYDIDIALLNDLIELHEIVLTRE